MAIDWPERVSLHLCRVPTVYTTYHCAVGHIWFIPDRNSPTCVESAEARRNVVWIAWTRHSRRAAARSGRPLEPTLSSQYHFLRTRVYRPHHQRPSIHC